MWCCNTGVESRIERHYSIHGYRITAEEIGRKYSDHPRRSVERSASSPSNSRSNSIDFTDDDASNQLENLARSARNDDPAMPRRKIRQSAPAEYRFSKRSESSYSHEKRKTFSANDIDKVDIDAILRSGQVYTTPQKPALAASTDNTDFITEPDQDREFEAAQQKAQEEQKLRLRHHSFGPSFLGTGAFNLSATSEPRYAVKRIQKRRQEEQQLTSTAERPAKADRAIAQSAPATTSNRTFRSKSNASAGACMQNSAGSTNFKNTTSAMWGKK